MNRSETNRSETEVSTPITAGFSLFTWLLIALFVILLILLAITLVLGALKSLNSPIISGASGSLLYASRFESHPEEWLQYEGASSSKIVDNGLHISVTTAGQGVYSALLYDFGDFDARVNVTRLSASDDYSEAGLLFRFRDKSNYFIFKTRGDGFYRVERWHDGQLEVLSEWHSSQALLPGFNTVNILRVVGQGSAFKFYANGQQLLLCPSGPGKQKSTWNGDKCLSNNQQTSDSLRDDSFSFGKIGVGAAAESEGGMEIAFEDVVVLAP